MSKAPPSPDSRDALSASSEAWWLSWLNWIVTQFADALTALGGIDPRSALAVTTFERVLKIYLLRRALPHFRSPRAKPGAGARGDYRREPPRGFRNRRFRGSTLRALTRNILPPAHGLAARMRRFLFVLTRIDRYIARLIKRHARGFIGARRLMVRPPALLLAGDAPACAPTPANSS